MSEEYDSDKYKGNRKELVDWNEKSEDWRITEIVKNRRNDLFLEFVKVLEKLLYSQDCECCDIEEKIENEIKKWEEKLI